MTGGGTLLEWLRTGRSRAFSRRHDSFLRLKRDEDR